jgi:hypothetical protein
MTNRILFFLATWACAVSLSAQDRYVIFIGNFLEPRMEDFASIRPAGFIHAGPPEAGVARIMLGGYGDKASAERALQFVQSQGYAYAYIHQQPLASGSNVAAVQIGTEKSVEPISWARYSAVGDLYGFMEGNEIKLFATPFSTIDEAKKKLPEIQQLGFKDAFIKMVNTAFLHKLGDFETGLKKPFISLPSNLNEASRPAPVPAFSEPKPAQSTTAANPAPADQVWKQTPTLAPFSLPAIRGNTKRRSVSDLQAALKTSGFYNGSLDGLYGAGTATAYEQFRIQNTLISRFENSMGNVMPNEEAAEFQRAISRLPDDAGAIDLISRTTTPLAKGYQAYLMFLRSGASEAINRLMNTAIQEAFQNSKWQVKPPFDYRATYSYQSLDQLVLHLHYLHSAAEIPFQASCQFPASAMVRVAEAYEGVNQDEFPFRGCIPFSFWPEISAAQNIAREIGASPKSVTPSSMMQNNLYHSPGAPRPEEEISLENWNLRLWKNLDAWAAADPLHANFIRAFKIVYLQSLVRLEDHFMDKGFKQEASRTLSLKAMQIGVGPFLQRFQ